MKLYITPLSPNVRRVRLTAAVLDMQIEEKILDFSKGEHKSPEYLKLNPNGAVPTLVDGSTVLTESRAIMQYLAARKPDSGLLPQDEQKRADTTGWQFWDAAHFSPALGTLTFEKIIKPMMGMGLPDEAKIAEALSNVRRFGAVLDQHLDAKPYVSGNRLTIADLTLACSLMYAHRTDAPVSDFRNIQSWFSRVNSLEAWKKTNPV